MPKKPIYREAKPERRQRSQQTPTPQVETNLPITRWEITESLYSADRQMVTFYNKHTKLGQMEIAPETTEEMIYAIATLLGYTLQIPGQETPTNTNTETETATETFPDISDLDPDNPEDPAREYFENSSIPDSWFITRPEDPQATPHLYLTENSQVTTIIPLTDTLLEDLIPRLRKIHDPNPRGKTFGDWIQKHTKTSVFAAVLLLGFVVYSIISTYIFPS